MQYLSAYSSSGDQLWVGRHVWDWTVCTEVLHDCITDMITPATVACITLASTLLHSMVGSWHAVDTQCAVMQYSHTVPQCIQ